MPELPTRRKLVVEDRLFFSSYNSEIQNSAWGRKAIDPMLSLRLLFVLVLGCVLEAHPMGNFSVSHYSRLEFQRDGLKLTYVLDLAEIPTFELFADWGVTPSDTVTLDRKAQDQARQWIRNLSISASGKNAAATLKSAKATISDGAGGMPVLRVAMEADVRSGPGELVYEDRNYSNRTGWKEIVIRKSHGVRLRSASQGEQDLSQGLTVYPPDLALAPPQDLRALVSWDVNAVQPSIAPLRPLTHSVSAARATRPPVTQPARPAVVASFAQNQPSAPGTVTRGDFLSRMLREKRFGWSAMLIGFFVAFGLGALHALSPGHGKTIVAAYLVGSRGTLRHALFLGSMVTFTHTISVFLLGLGVLFFQRYVVPDQIIPVLGSVSGLSIVCIGLWLLYQRSMALIANTPARSAALELVLAAEMPASEPEPEEVFAHAGAAHHAHDHMHAEHQHDHHQHSQDVRHHAHDHAHGHGHHAHDGHHHHNHDHGHAHHPDHHPGAFVHTHTHNGHTHSHEMPASRITLGSLIALGASGGLVPCPSALILLLSAIALGHAALGLFLLVGFSAGLALVLMAIGALVLYARHLLPKSESAGQHPAFRLVPVFSAVVVVVLGLLMTLTAAGVIQPVRFLGS
jgi:nickel/cobalt transporter (NicO) family protein